MPIKVGTVDLELKLLPLVLEADGSARVSVRKGYTQDGVFNAIAEEQHSFSIAEVSAVLDTMPMQGLSRRDDLSFAVYSMLVSKGLATGTIS